MARSKGCTNADIGERVRAQRMKAGQTQAELGDALGLSYQSISQYENGVTPITALQLVRIATALKCKTTDLIP